MPEKKMQVPAYAVMLAAMLLFLGAIFYFSLPKAEDDWVVGSYFTYNGSMYCSADSGQTTRQLPQGYEKIGVLQANPHDKSGQQYYMPAEPAFTFYNLSPGTEVYINTDEAGVIYLRYPDKPYYDPYVKTPTEPE